VVASWQGSCTQQMARWSALINWLRRRDKVTFPIGLQVGHLFHVGSLPLKG
jgi:hypothetical protein